MLKNYTRNFTNVFQKRHLVLTFLLSFLLVICIPTTKPLQAQHQLCKDIAADFGMEFAVNYLESSIIFDEMWELFPRNGEGNVQFPAYYGGHFFCGQGKINVNIVDSLMEEAKAGDLSEILARDSVQVFQVKFSYQELMDTLDEITDYVSNNLDCTLAITTWGMDATTNKAVVQVELYNEEVEALFRQNVLDSLMITLKEGEPVATLIPNGFEPGEQNPFNTTSLATDLLFAAMPEPICEVLATDSDIIEQFGPGMRIYIDNYGFSAGYPASREQELGFVTALHGLSLADEFARLGTAGGPLVAEVSAPIQFQGSVDGAFLPLYHSIFSQTADNRKLLYSDIRPAQGMILVSISTPPDGIIHTQRNIVVTDAHFMANLGGGLVLTNMIQTTGNALNGQSGGLVFRTFGDDAQVKGIIVGSNATSATGENMFFAWSESVNDAIGVTQP